MGRCSDRALASVNGRAQRMSGESLLGYQLNMPIPVGLAFFVR